MYNYFYSTTGNTSLVEEAELAQMHWDISKLLSFGVSEEFLMESGVTPQEATDLVKGALYLRERYPEDFV